MIDRFARKAVTTQLAQMRGGPVTVMEHGRREVFGQTGDISAASQGGSIAECQVTVHDPRLYRRMLLGGSLAAAESYLDGDWDCDNLTALIRFLVRNEKALQGLDSGLARVAGWGARFWHRLRRNTRAGSRRNIAAHYDLGNEFFQLFLDETMMYSSGIFPTEESTLLEASIEKNDRICRKLQLQPGDHLLEIGTGWGGFAVYAAEHYGCRVTTTTISRKQFTLARRRVAEAGLTDRVNVLLSDYRDLTGTFDKLVSIEMIEAVGHQYFDTFFRKCGGLLKADGLMLLQGIVMQEQRYAEYLRSTDFIQRYVFPGGCLPTPLALTAAAARTSDLYPVHHEDFADHYARTLACWRTRFQERVDEVRAQGFDEQFLRTWHYYFCYCEAAFAERYIGLAHLMLAKAGWRGDTIDCAPIPREYPAATRFSQMSDLEASA
ncbi:MAG: class I SAM-dependent methyltransferase [Planctomycetaceae bacterium]|nr:MAG: class I SAM-dependent methyltransferase [Planctomycetaceae bacterium]